jgi:hypothetical protein
MNSFKSRPWIMTLAFVIAAAARDMLARVPHVCPENQNQKSMRRLIVLTFLPIPRDVGVVY